MSVSLKKNDDDDDDDDDEHTTAWPDVIVLKPSLAFYYNKLNWFVEASNKQNIYAMYRLFLQNQKNILTVQLLEYVINMIYEEIYKTYHIKLISISKHNELLSLINDENEDYGKIEWNRAI